MAHELAYRVVEQVAPEELTLFRVISEAYQRDPTRVATGAGDPDEPLGFGVETAAVLLTPVVLAAVTEVSRYLAGEVAGAFGMQAWLRHRMRRRRRRRSSARPEAPPALTAEQLDRVRAIVRDKCEQAGVAKARAELVADAVVGALTDGA